MMKYYVSAYATSPSFQIWNPSLEKEYFNKLASNEKIVGIEHPFFLNSEKYSIDWVIQNIPAHWNVIITILPALMQAQKEDADFGLASNSEKSRLKTIDLINKVHNYMGQLNHKFNRNIVKAIHLQSSPKSSLMNIRGSAKAFEKSLQEVALLDWGDTELNIEHCDAFIPGKIAEKGYLTLDNEIDIVKKFGKFGIILNWGRSAIETHSTDGPPLHVEKTVKKGVLRGFTFSGCTAVSTSEYGQWKDTHAPTKRIIDSKYLVDDSLLGYNEIAGIFSLLKAYKKNIYYGVKVLDPSNSSVLDKKIHLNFDTIEAIEKVHEDQK